MRTWKTLVLVLGTVALACGPQSGGTGPDAPGGGGGVAPLDEGEQPTATPEIPNDEFRATQPAAGAPRPFNLPKVQTFRMADAIDVYLVEKHDLPTISVRIVFEGGAATDGAKSGLASTCMSMMSEGTVRLDKLALKAELADIGSSIGSSAGLETQSVSMNTLSKHLKATNKLYLETLQTPAFRKAELNRMVSRRIESLKQSKASPASIARRLLSSVAYGPRHPAGNITTKKSLGRIRSADCKRYHKSYIKPNGAKMFVVGDMTEAQIRAAYSPVIAKWKGKPRKVRKMPKRKLRNGRIFFVDAPGAAQSSIYLIHGGPKRNDDHYFDNAMMSAILGGGFSSRINMNLREDKGYSYGARGNFSYNRDFGTFYASSSVRSNATLQSIREIRGEIRRLKNGKVPATAAELDREKNGAVLGVPARFATARQSLGQFARLVYFGLPLNYYENYVANVSGVDLARVATAAKRELRPGKLQILIVGDAMAMQKIRAKGSKDDTDLIKDGAKVTLLQALTAATKAGEFGAGKLVFLDKDGKRTKAPKRATAK